MRPSMSLVSLLLLILLFNTAKGIRLEQHTLTSIHSISTQEANIRGEGSPEEELVVCGEEEACSGLNSKKVLMIKRREAMTSSPKSKDIKEIKASAAQSTDKESLPESYPDIFDIAGMDYSPAKKKSPIHN